MSFAVRVRRIRDSKVTFYEEAIFFFFRCSRRYASSDARFNDCCIFISLKNQRVIMQIQVRGVRNRIETARSPVGERGPGRESRPYERMAERAQSVLYESASSPRIRGYGRYQECALGTVSHQFARRRDTGFDTVRSKLILMTLRLFFSPLRSVSHRIPSRIVRFVISSTIFITELIHNIILKDRSYKYSYGNIRQIQISSDK